MDSARASVYRLQNDNGMEVVVSAYGGIIQKLTAPDRHGRYTDVVLGFDTMDGYFGKHPYFGAIVGRYANRIGNSRFELEGATYELTPGGGGHHLHGGNNGFDKVLWRTSQSELSSRSLRLCHVSEDGDEGYPGELSVQVDYALSDRDELSISYRATTDKTTVVNLSNHSYFNLGGPSRGNILDHIVELNADSFTPVNGEMIATGELRDVTGTPMDLRQPTRIGDHIDDDDEQLGYGLGFDHNWALNRTSGGLQFAARVTDPESGRVLVVSTREPGVQFYSGNRLDGSIAGKAGQVYRSRSGFCIETQHFPDSPNQPAFPSTVLKSGETYHSNTVYAFSCP
jgi:aldose 1-epimerase